MGEIKKIEEIVKEYLQLLKQKEDLEERLELLKQKLADFSKKNKKKGFVWENEILVVSVKKKTIFPKKKEAGRKELEEILQNSGEMDKAITFDILKLAEAYDDKKLSSELREKLKPFTKTEEVVRIYTKEVKDKL